MTKQVLADRYQVTKLIEWWDQEKLANATVLLCGVGAAGNEVAKNLALLGIGRLILVDFDIIETNNLLKTVLFREKDVNQRKVDAAARAIREINPDVEVWPVHGNLMCDFPLGLIHDADVVLCALDSFGSRWFLNRVCFETGTPWVDGGLDVLDGRVRSFYPQKTGCLECDFDPDHYARLDRRVGCGFLAARLPPAKIPTTPTSASIVGGFMVQEAIKLIHGDTSTAGHVFDYHGNFYVIHYQIKPKETCFLACTTLPLPVIEWAADSARVTLTDLFDFAAGALNTRDLQLMPYARYTEPLHCPACDHQAHCCLSEEYLLETGGVPDCPECGAQRQAVPLDVFLPDDKFCCHTLKTLGFPSRHLYRMRKNDYTVTLIKIDEPVPEFTSFE